VVLIRGLSQHVQPQLRILLKVGPCQVQIAYLELSIRQSLLGCLQQPFHALGFILFDTLAKDIQATQFELRPGEALLGGPGIPFDSLFPVSLCPSFAAGIACFVYVMLGQLELGRCITGLCFFPDIGSVVCPRSRRAEGYENCCK